MIKIGEEVKEEDLIMKTTTIGEIENDKIIGRGDQWTDKVIGETGIKGWRGNSMNTHKIEIEIMISIEEEINIEKILRKIDREIRE